MDESRSPADERSARHAERNRRLRRAFLDGAEQQSMRALGRGLTVDELRRVLRWYPGEVAERGDR